MTKWNNLFESLFHKTRLSYTLDIEVITDRRSTVQENLILHTERFLDGEGKGKIEPIYGMVSAAW